MPQQSRRNFKMAEELAWLAAAGAAGTMARYGVSSLVLWLAGPRFPWGTLTVNVFGCLLFGLVWTLAEERLVLQSQTRLVVLVGFMGAFTTFSTFAFETSVLLRESQWLAACGNILANNVICILAAFCGFALGKWI